MEKGAETYAEAIGSLPFPQGANERKRLVQSVKDDVQFLKHHPLWKPEIRVTGWIYDLETGSVEKIHLQ
jgi:carbonic anhydrase